MQWAFQRALHERFNATEVPNEASRADLDSIHQRAHELFVANIRAQRQQSPADAHANFRQLLDDGTRPVEAVAEELRPEGLGHFLAQCIIGSWTAFETLAGDLWEAALNSYPHGLSELKGFRRKKDKASDSDNDSARARLDRTEKVINLNQLQRYQYDLRNKMGSALRYRQRFDHLQGIREAYIQAFHEAYDPIDAIILNDRTIDAVCAIRNVLVHKAGIADDDYLRSAKYLNVPKADKGRAIHLDGEIIYNLCLELHRLCFALVIVVDGWIAIERARKT
jgi:hypothetical protein